MPGCMLRAADESFNVDVFLSASPWEPLSVYRQGEARHPRSRGARTASGFDLLVSDEDTVAAQTKDVLAFLAANEPEILRLVRILGPERVVLDFGTAFRDVAAQSENFSAALVRAAGVLGLALEVSLYAIAEETENEESGASAV